jgi:hypothetical protein
MFHINNLLNKHIKDTFHENYVHVISTTPSPCLVGGWWWCFCVTRLPRDPLDKHTHTNIRGKPQDISIALKI